MYFKQRKMERKKEMWYSVGEVKRRYQISRHSLYQWEKEGHIKGYRTPGGHKRYKKEDIEKMLGYNRGEDKEEETIAIYSRVSTKKQEKYLQNQEQRLKEYCSEKRYKIGLEISEIASGVNENRRGLGKLMKKARKGEITKIVIDYKDRLARFGYKYLERFFVSHGVSIEILNAKEGEEIQEELAEDLVSIVSSFAAKIYGRRGGKKKNIKK